MIDQKVSMPGVIMNRYFTMLRYPAIVLLGSCLALYVPLTADSTGNGIAFAQQAKDEEKPERKTKKAQAMSEKVYRRIAEAQELVDIENFPEALESLDEVKKMKKLSTYETAQMWNFYGFVYYAQDDIPKAINAYETVLQQPDIPDSMSQSTTYTLAQLHFSVENYAKAIELVEQWLVAAENPGYAPYELLATAYYQFERYAEMIDPIQKAMAIAKKRDQPEKQNWWLLLRVAYYELNDLAKVRDVLEVLVVNWPKKEYWTQLSAMYGELEDENKQLSAYVSAYDQGLLTRSSELVQLSQLYMQANVPYKAARIIENGFVADIVERKSSNYRLLSQAWQLAQNDIKAIPALRTAAEMHPDGDLDVRLAQSYLNVSEYNACITSTKTGLDKGELRSEDIAYVILGTCYFELEQYNDALDAFREAAKFDNSKERARVWLTYIEGEKNRKETLDQSLRDAQRR